MMTTQTITIELPEPVFRHLQRVAATTQQSIEIVVAQSVLSNLPPSTDNAPPDLQPELLAMQTESVETLHAIAQSQVDPQQHERHKILLQKNEDTQLTPDEQEELSSLRQASDHLMLRKAYAWSMLRWRGHRIPPLHEWPIQP